MEIDKKNAERRGLVDCVAVPILFICYVLIGGFCASVLVARCMDAVHHFIWR